jgi:acyl-CoA reductase-like NAD-dependent aldehyde dehydrogenase
LNHPPHEPNEVLVMSDVTPFLLSGKPATGDETLSVTSPWDGSVVGEVSVPTDAQVEQAVTDLDAVRHEAQATPAHVRAAALDHISARLSERAEEIAALITAENGKPLVWSRGEVTRAVSTFRWAAEETRRFAGDLQRLDTDAAATGRIAVVRRFPRGPVLGIAPFNFPLNLVAHKVAPAIAVGAPILVKPAPATPLSALLLGEIIAETDLPPRMVSVLPVPNERMSSLVTDPRLPVISFTGSGPVGLSLQEQAPGKHITLELGGDAAVIVTADWPDLSAAASRIALFANYQAGQSCIAVQRVLVHTDVYDAFVPELVSAVEALPTGDPTAEGVQVGPVISDAAAERITGWVAEAAEAGASVLTGGTRDGRTVAPTVLADVPAGTKIAEEEVFGPVLYVARYGDLDEAFATVNSSKYGLQAGIFTTDVRTAFRAHRDLEVGGVIVGDVPSYRADQMPYGGWKQSGVGREGLRSAMNDLTEERVMVLTGLDL